MMDDEFIRALATMLPGYVPSEYERRRLASILNTVSHTERQEIERQLEHLDPGTQPSLMVGGRRAGKTNASANLHQPSRGTYAGATGPLPREFSEVGLGNGDVIRWVARGRGPMNSNIEYTYAAVFADSHWFITGAGKWYDTNRLTMQQMNEVLMRDEIITIEFAHQYIPAESALTRARP